MFDLSRQEVEVALLVAQGMSNAEIAGAMQLTEHTVKNYLYKVYNKAGVNNRVRLAKLVWEGKISAAWRNLDSAAVS